MCEVGMGHAMMMNGLAASPQLLALVVALLCFLIAGGFLLFLVSEARQRPSAEDDAGGRDPRAVRTAHAAEAGLPGGLDAAAGCV
jgi:hypothetical protein